MTPDKIWVWEKHSKVIDGNAFTTSLERKWAGEMLPEVAATIGAVEYRRICAALKEQPE